MSDLGDTLSRAGDSLGGDVGPVEEATLRRIVGGARRRRVRRHTVQAVAGVALVAVLGGGGWWGMQREAPAPAHTPTPQVTTSATPTATPTPTPTPTASEPPEPVVRQTAIDDATVLRRLAEPRTGETWHAPEPADDVRLVASEEYGTEWAPRTVKVGERGDAVVYAVVGEHYHYDARRDVLGLFEVDAAGARYIACPSPRTEDCDPEVPGAPSLDPAVTVDVDTFYDTLGIPVEAELVDGFTVRTAGGIMRERRDWSTGTDRVVAPLGNGVLLVPPTDSEWHRAEDAVDVARYGPAALVELHWQDGEVDGLTNVSYAWRLPFGAHVALAPEDVPGADWDAIVWDDGVDRRVDVSEPGFPAATVAPGARSCTAATFSIADPFDRRAWRPAGRTPEGARVHVPVAGGNDLARQVRSWQERISWSVGPDDGTETLQGAEVYAETGMTTDAAFLAANALFAVERPDGVWMLGLSPAAAAPVWECV